MYEVMNLLMMSVSSSSNSSSDEDAEDHIDLVMFMYLKKHVKLDRKPCRTSTLSEKEYLREIVCGNPIQCYELFRMKPHVFLNLCDKLKLLGLLQDSRNVSIEEGMAMTLRILCHGNTQREVSDRFQHSTGTIHYWFKTVLRALKAFALTVVKPVDRGAVQPEILADSRWYPFFKNCIGAIDGTHVAAWAPASKQKSFRGRKAVLVTQNVMAVCSHDMMFTFVYTGWEGTANDSRVFYDAINRPENKFPMPSGDYFYVVHSGYLNLKGFLVPYRGEQYHRSDWQGDERVTGKEEMFNFIHSFVRNVIERAFGVLKARFRILKAIPNYPLRRQMLIQHACCALHNYIRMEDRADKLFTEYGQDYLEVPRESSNVIQEGFSFDMTDNNEMLQVRASITNALWDKYMSRRQSRRQH
uniref:protein ALP1-like n=1 Tax=Erigeron canadensis TaxID=72917 RepID=UPI001CB952A0|nr:protein ALP1-like [Erigeron canadensis]